MGFNSHLSFEVTEKETGVMYLLTFYSLAVSLHTTRFNI